MERILVIEVFNDQNEWEYWNIYKESKDETQARMETLADFVGEIGITDWVKSNYEEFTRAKNVALLD